MSIKDTLKAKWGYVVGALAAVAALVAVLTPTPKDEELGNKYSPEFKAAWERGAAYNGEASTTQPEPAGE